MCLQVLSEASSPPWEIGPISRIYSEPSLNKPGSAILALPANRIFKLAREGADNTQGKSIVCQ
jgi:hypothetical protein